VGGHQVTDLETLRAMLTKAGVVFTEEPREHDPTSFYLKTVPAGITLSIPSDPPQHNFGYGNFVADWYFDASGALHSVGIWE